MSRVRMSAWSLVAAAACWGTATAISKRAVDEIAPLTLLPLQLSVSVGVLFLASLGMRERQHPTEHAAQLAWLGVLNPGLSYALSLAGLSRITASASALLWATEPILILLLAWYLLRQRPSGPVIGCASVALVGVVLVVAQPGVRATTTGVTLTLAGVAACAVYTVVSGRYLADASTLGVVILQQSAALVFALFLFAGAAVTGNAGSVGDASATAWISAFTSGALYYGVAFWFYVRGLRTCAPAVAGLFINLVPVFGVTAAALLLDERFVGRQWLGAAISLGAVTALASVQTVRVRPSAT
ncbi:MAG: DMT family transporter [Ilumatobacteraceae bacterium]